MLQPRHKKIIRLFMLDGDRKKIAGDLGVGYNTLKQYFDEIYKLLGIGSERSLILWALANPERWDNDGIVLRFHGGVGVDSESWRGPLYY